MKIERASREDAVKIERASREDAVKIERASRESRESREDALPVERASCEPLYLSGLDCRAVGKLLGISRQAVWRQLWRSGVKLRSRGRPLGFKAHPVRLDAEIAEQLRIGLGWSLAEIGREFGVSRQAVWRALRRAAERR